jgi:hypothetical protein
MPKLHGMQGMAEPAAAAANPEARPAATPNSSALRPWQSAFLAVPWWAAVLWSASLAAAALGVWLLFERNPLIPCVPARYCPASSWLMISLLSMLPVSMLPSIFLACKRQRGLTAAPCMQGGWRRLDEHPGRQPVAHPGHPVVLLQRPPLPPAPALRWALLPDRAACCTH